MLSRKLFSCKLLELSWSELKIQLKISIFSTLGFANSPDTRISIEDSVHCCVKGLIHFFLIIPGTFKQNMSYSSKARKPLTQYLSENGMLTVHPSETAQNNAFNFASIIACLYFGTMKLNRYFGIVELGETPYEEKSRHAKGCIWYYLHLSSIFEGFMS